MIAAVWGAGGPQRLPRDSQSEGSPGFPPSPPPALGEQGARHPRPDFSKPRSPPIGVRGCGKGLGGVHCRYLLFPGKGLAELVAFPLELFDHRTGRR